jgi:3-hydroxyacyl-[acyl-carrier-protein] dehydratase
MRWIWIDRFTSFESGKSATAVKNLSLAEDHFADHFPGYPVMPAPLILEGLAQTGGILVGEANDFREKVILAKINSARFYREALAGQRLVYDAELLTLREEGGSIAGKVHLAEGPLPQPGGPGSVPGPPVCQAEIFFAHLDRSRSEKIFGEQNFVFSGELKHLLGLSRVLPRGPATDATAPG